MRTLNYINDFSDIYQLVPEEDIDFIENELDFIIPEELKNIYRNPDIDSIKILPSLFWMVHHESLGIVEINNWLYAREDNPFPKTLVAFATGECGDYWVINKTDQSIIYIDPDQSIEENLLSKELCFTGFSEWLQSRKHNKK